MIRFLRKQRSRGDWIRLSDHLSSLLLKAIFALLLLLAIFQLAMQNDTVRGMLTSTDRWEGTRLN
ncbi:hypothetical protein D3P07_07315 [Paenibacillus sp. 1011MAR3C5]|uniref:hypothetical protein n=1 Tax=Paenibacillus sp. 1011MAR3C5 TaxID=1675787 RepID=UPI000E6BA493|nr:hypothetical protein [Paenibacillus sp. 1011MAR3C5]RJE90018.1 hypothetical protein D3P07_07315 [Paenibacillus sp. 1011MAR3C5]